MLREGGQDTRTLRHALIVSEEQYLNLNCNEGFLMSEEWSYHSPLEYIAKEGKDSTPQHTLAKPRLHTSSTITLIHTQLLLLQARCHTSPPALVFQSTLESPPTASQF